MKYVTAKYLADETGLSARYFTRKAAEGIIPGAHQPSGPGGAWRFDLNKFRVWWNASESYGNRTWHPSFDSAMRRAKKRDTGNFPGVPVQLLIDELSKKYQQQLPGRR